MKRALEVYDWYGGPWNDPEPVPEPVPPDDMHRAGAKHPLASKDPRIAADYATSLPHLTRIHDLRPDVGETYSLADAGNALDRLAARDVVGKIALDILGRARQRVG